MEVLDDELVEDIRRCPEKFFPQFLFGKLELHTFLSAIFQLLSTKSLVKSYKMFAKIILSSRYSSFRPPPPPTPSHPAFLILSFYTCAAFFLNDKNMEYLLFVQIFWTERYLEFFTFS